MANDILTYIGHCFIVLAKVLVWLIKTVFVIVTGAYCILAEFCAIMLNATLAIFSGE